MLRLGFYQLNPADISIMQLILASAAQKLSGWEVVNTPPYDILVVDVRAPVLNRPAAKTFVKKFLRISDANLAQDEATLIRPLRSSQVETWLMAHNSAITYTYQQPLILDKFELNTSTRFKLLKWPPHELLLNNSWRTKIATLLTRHAMCANQLAGVAHLPIGECLEFLKILKSLNLISACAVVKNGGVTAYPANTLKILNSSPKVSLGFLARLRARLGI